MRGSHIRCGNNVAALHPWKISGTFKWWWISGSTPSYLSRSNTLTSLRNARIEWESNVNWCNYADSSSVDFAYQGEKQTSFGDNGVNTIGWGTVCAPSAACTRVEFSNGVVAEADTSMNSNLTWRNGNSSASNEYDVQNVFAHETGHVTGLNDVTDTTNLMYEAARADDLSGRKLGKGDATWNNSRY